MYCVVAAGCAGDVGTTFTDIRVGILDSSTFDVAEGSTVDVFPCFVHALFFADIAVIKLTSPVSGNAAPVNPVNNDKSQPALNGIDIQFFGKLYILLFLCAFG